MICRRIHIHIQISIRININKGNQQKLTLSEYEKYLKYPYEYEIRVRRRFHRLCPRLMSLLGCIVCAPPNDYPKKCINLKVITHLCITSRVFCAAVAAVTNYNNRISIKSLYSSLCHLRQIYLTRWRFLCSPRFRKTYGRPQHQAPKEKRNNIQWK